MKNNEILTPSFLETFSNKDLKWEIAKVRNMVDNKLKKSLKEVETFSVDWFVDQYVNNPNIQKDLDDWFKAERTWYWYLLKVNISSPSSVIDINSDIFKNILLQTTSIYHENHVDPMIPFSLSNNLFSLIYDKIRLGLTVEIELDLEWNVWAYKIYQSKIKNILMANHNEFHKILKNCAWKELNKFNDDIKILKEIWDILAKKRIHNNWFSSSFDSQRKVGYDKLDLYEIWYVSSVVEEIMILTNSLVAKFLIENPWITGIFRNHMPEYRWKKFEWWEMQRATYNTKMKYHYWLLMDEYTHFTSPIRRAPDLLLHYWINAFLEKKEQIFEENNLEEYLQNYLNPKQELLIKETNESNEAITKKKKEEQERDKVIKYIKENPVDENNIWEVPDFDLEINLYNFFKNKENIPEYYFQELEKIFDSKKYNRKLLFILAFSKNDKLLEIFNKYFKSYNMQNAFVEYFNNSDFISNSFNISFVKEKNKKNKNNKNKIIYEKKIKNKLSFYYYLNKNRKKIFSNKSSTKSQVFKKLLQNIFNSKENFLK